MANEQKSTQSQNQADRIAELIRQARTAVPNGQFHR